MSTNFYLWIAMAQMGKHLPTTWDPGLIPGMGRSPEEGNGNPLHYSCLENSMDGGAWLARVHGIIKSQTRLSDFTLLVVGTQICSFNTTKGCVRVQEG